MTQRDKSTVADPPGLWRIGPWSVILPRRVLAVNAGLAGLALAMMALSLTLGRMEISLRDIAGVLTGATDDGPMTAIIRDIRLPRVLAAVFAGAALGISGAVFQAVSRNVLGSPDIIGFTTGAATGALAQIIFFDQTAAKVALAAVAGGLLTALFVYVLARRHGVVDSTRLVLTGIGTGAVLMALNGLMLVKGDLDTAVLADLWLAGSLHARTWAHVIPVMLGVALLGPVVLWGGRGLEMIRMGDDIASQLGVRVERLRLTMIVCAVMLAALATGAVGPIAFVALAAPQLALRLGRASGLPVVGAGLMGGCLLLSADLLAQLMPLRISIPVGRMTGIIGGLYLIWLLTQRRANS